MRPRSIEPGDLLQQALEVYRRHFGVLFPLALIVGLIQAMLLLGLGGDDPTTLTGGDIAATALSLLPMLVFLAFTVELLRDLRAGGDVRPTGELVRSVVPVLLPLLAITVLGGIAVGIGLILLIVPGLFLATIWSVVVPVYMVERPGIAASFDRSRALVRGYGWSVFATLALIVLIGLIGAIVGAIVSIDPTTAVGSFVQLVITSLVTPVTTLMVGGLYFRLFDAFGRPTAPGSADDAARDTAGTRD